MFDQYESDKAEAISSVGNAMQNAIDQYGYLHGEEHPDRQWILSPLDSWERNPHYVGEDQPHPEEHHNY